MKTLLYLLLICFFSNYYTAQTFSWSGFTAGGTSYSTGALTVTVTSGNPGFQYSSPKYYAGSTVGSGQCGIAGGLALEHLFGNITTAFSALLLDFTSGGTTTGTCSTVNFQIKDINADESVQTFADWVEITAIDGNNTPIVVASITATGGSNKVITSAGNTRIIKGYSNSTYGSRSSTTCDNVTITVTPPVGVAIKSITLKYHPDYTVSPNNYYNFTSPLRPAYQYVSIGSITATPTGSCVVLPVELSSFSATRDGKLISLNWQTESERENDYFLLERTTDGQSFETIAKIDGQGTKSSPSNYSFNEINLLSENSYYRLQQVDFNGRPTYHDLTMVVPYRSEKTLQSVYPNPCQDNLVCTLHLERAQEISIEIRDVNGRLMDQKKWIFNSGFQYPTFNLSPLQKGVYQLIVRLEDGTTETQRIIKEF